MVNSPKMSLKGWKISEWVKGNWSTIKEALKVGIPFLLSLAVVQDNYWLMAVITAGGKLVLDLGHYYIKAQ